MKRTKRKSRRASEKEEQAAVPAVTTPFIDGVCIGGLALVVVVLVVAYQFVRPAEFFVLNLSVYYLTETFINGPHFMASYRILYRTKENIKSHWFVAIGVPLLLAMFIADGAWHSYYNPNSRSAIQWLVPFVTPAILAWHYTGQAWGIDCVLRGVGQSEDAIN